MPKLDDQISTLQQRLQQLQLRQQRIEERKRAILATRNRKDNTRRKILLGGLILDKIERGEIERASVLDWLDQTLTRTADRALFELPTTISFGELTTAEPHRGEAVQPGAPVAADPKNAS